MTEPNYAVCIRCNGTTILFTPAGPLCLTCQQEDSEREMLDQLTEEIMMENLYAFDKEDGLHVQRAKYIEDGWFLIHCNKENVWKVFDIPLGGGREDYIGSEENFKDAIKLAKSIT